MDCKQAEQLIVDYVYGELGAPQRTQFESHIQHCSACSQEVADHQGVLQLVRKYQADAPPQAIDQKILDAASEVFTIPKPKKPGWQMFVLRPILIPAVLVFVISAVGLLFYLEEPEMTAEPDQKSTPALPYLPPAAEPEEAVASVETASDEAVRAFDSESKEKRFVQAAKNDVGDFSQAKSQKVASAQKITPSRPPDKLAGPKMQPRKKSKPRSVVERTQAIPEAKPQSLRAGDKSKPGRGRFEAKQRPASTRKKRKGLNRDTLQKKQALSPVQPSLGSAKGLAKSLPPEPQAKRAAEIPSTQAAPIQELFQSRETEDQRLQSEIEPKPFRRAQDFFQAGQCRQAIKEYTAAIQANPKHPLVAEALFDQASCHTKLGQYQQAIEIYKRIMRRYPKHKPRAQREIQRLSK